jgi:membrane-associated phospholipid phosphatase
VVSSDGQQGQQTVERIGDVGGFPPADGARPIRTESASPEAVRPPGTEPAGAEVGPPTAGGAGRSATDRTPARIVPIHRLRGTISLLQWPPSRQMVIRLLIGCAIVAVAGFTNRSFLGWGLFATVAVLVVPVGRARSFVLAFIPYATVWFVFTALRSFADETALADTLNLYVARFERWIFGGQLPTVTLQSRFFDFNDLRWYDYFLTGIHWSYFIIPHALAFRLWQTRPDLFRRYLWAMTLLLGVGLMIYFLIPSNPPWLAGEQQDSPASATVYRIMEPVGEQLGGGLYNASYKVVGESNPIAAMPSIHMAITALLIFPAGCFGRRWRLAAIVYATLMGIALVYLGEHFIIDVLVGTAIAAYGWFAAGAWLGRVGPLVAQRFAAAPAPAPAALAQARSGR